MSQDLGWVKAVHKGTTPPTNTDMLWSDSNFTPPVMKEYDGVSWNTVSPSYTNASPSVIAVGGIPVGTPFSNFTFKDFMDGAFYPELFGTLTAPSSTFTSNVTGFKEIGEVIALISFTSAFNRGSINPQYQSASPYRSGLPNTYVYTGSGLSNFASTSLTDAKSVSNYTVLTGANNWTGRVAYDAGVQPKGSKGTDFNTPLLAGQTGAVTRTITGVYPWFATTSAIDTLTKGSLQAHASQVFTSMVAEDGVNKQTFDLPQAWGAISALAQYNTLSGQYDTISLASFTRTNITKTINGSTVNYYHYVHNGSTIGARQLRWTV